MNRNYFLLAGVFILVALLAAPAQAGMLSQIVTLDDGVQDILKDNSVATVVDLDNDSKLSNGDVIYGIIRIVKRESLPTKDLSPTIGEVDVAYAFQITGTGVSGAPSGYVGFTLGVASNVLKNLLPSHGLDQNDVFVLLTDPPPAVDVTTLTVLNAFATLNSSSYTKELAGTIGAGDFAEAYLRDYNTNGDIDIDEYANKSAGTGIGAFVAGLTYTYLPTNILVKALVDVEHILSGTITSHDAVITGTLQVPTSGQKDNGWMFQDQSYMRTNLTPEPGTLVAIVGLGLTGLAGRLVTRRRRHED